MLNKPPLNLDVNKYIYIGCIPQLACPNHPPDQLGCIIENCPHCNKPMWVSERKRILRAALPEEALTYCLECLVIAARNQGFEPESMDIGKNNAPSRPGTKRKKL